jgi:hypothetical protein
MTGSQSKHTSGRRPETIVSWDMIFDVFGSVRRKHGTRMHRSDQ